MDCLPVLFVRIWALVASLCSLTPRPTSPPSPNSGFVCFELFACCACCCFLLRFAIVLCAVCGVSHSDRFCCCVGARVCAERAVSSRSGMSLSVRALCSLLFDLLFASLLIIRVHFICFCSRACVQVFSSDDIAFDRSTIFVWTGKVSFITLFSRVSHLDMSFALFLRKLIFRVVFYAG